MTVATVSFNLAATRGSESIPVGIQLALAESGKNREQIRDAIDNVKPEYREGMVFLITHMPSHDLRHLSSKFLLENVNYSYRAWERSSWKNSIPKHIFLNDILPYACVSERRDRWRKDFYERFQPHIKDAGTSGEAAVILNQKVFRLLKVRYSTERRAPDQSSVESMKLGIASCTGLSILLVDACRSVGVPARLVGTPLWPDRSGNHSWVEVWDDGWHFTGAAEPTGHELDKAWFLAQASKADRHHKLHAIYATSYRKTPEPFLMVWDPQADYVSAINVTDRYVHAVKKLPEGSARVMFQATEPDGSRCRALLRIRDAAGKTVFEDMTNDERFDLNNHLTAELKRDRRYQVEFKLAGQQVIRSIRVSEDGQLVSVKMSAAGQ